MMTGILELVKNGRIGFMI